MGSDATSPAEGPRSRHTNGAIEHRKARPAVTPKLHSPLPHAGTAIESGTPIERTAAKSGKMMADRS